jgi:hypothetical protein
MLRRLAGLRPWPLLIAALAAFIAGTRLLTETGNKELAAAALIVVGSICIGAWITMLATHDYPGHEEETDGKP